MSMPALGLLAHALRHRCAHARVIGGLVVIATFQPRLHHVEQVVRPRQAADMRGHDPIRVLLPGHRRLLHRSGSGNHNSPPCQPRAIRRRCCQPAGGNDESVVDRARLDRRSGACAERHRACRPVRLRQRADPHHLADAADAVAEIFGPRREGLLPVAHRGMGQGASRRHARRHLQQHRHQRQHDADAGAGHLRPDA